MLLTNQHLDKLAAFWITLTASRPPNLPSNDGNDLDGNDDDEGNSTDPNASVDSGDKAADGPHVQVYVFLAWQSSKFYVCIGEFPNSDSDQPHSTALPT